ncbi:MAG TPA: twin-arginine translocase TatA/TatE family subunit [Aggregatilineales bacterium]|jgi:sec-independent protein translocase protein TatA|nr:twin-arginine translocase TatA/TatE family subunit [Aggregatilineales bacterium]
MFHSLGPTELIIILVIVIVLFGVGRIARLGSELGTAIGEFRKGVRGADDDTPLEQD